MPKGTDLGLPLIQAMLRCSAHFLRMRTECSRVFFHTMARTAAFRQPAIHLG
jgi:hypothetical protein